MSEAAERFMALRMMTNTVTTNAEGYLDPKAGKGASWTSAGRWAAANGRCLRSPCLQGFNTEVAEILCALRVEVFIATEHTEPLCMKNGQFLGETKPTSHLESAC